jgi:hypothetical protein
VCQFRAFTVICAVGVVALPPLVTVTLTVPPFTMTPDQVLLVLLLVTGELVPSENFQLEKVLLLGPVAVQVTVPPLVTEEVQVTFATFSCWFGL